MGKMWDAVRLAWILAPYQWETLVCAVVILLVICGWRS